jgi:hypothetical protein
MYLEMSLEDFLLCSIIMQISATHQHGKKIQALRNTSTFIRNPRHLHALLIRNQSDPVPDIDTDFLT